MKFVKSLENRLPSVMKALHQVATSGKYSEGFFTKKAEEQLSSRTGRRAVVLNSCGSALFLTLKFLFSQGSRSALVQNNTFFASGAMAREAGMAIALVDSRPDCPSMSLSSLKEAYKKFPARVVILTHVGGWVAKDYYEIAEFCREHAIDLVEDCAHALGLPVGQHSTAACWSFYPTKAVPAGEGGAVTSLDIDLIQYVTQASRYGKVLEEGLVKYYRGMNLRMSEWDAAVLSVQLEFLPEILKMRREDAAALQLIAPCLLGGESNFYKYPVKHSLATRLRTLGKVYARSDQLDVCLSGYGVVSTGVSLENSHHWAHTHACLPIGEGLYTGMTTGEIHRSLIQDMKD